MLRRRRPGGDGVDRLLDGPSEDRLEEVRRRVGICLITLAVALLLSLFPIPFVTPGSLTQTVIAAISGPASATHVPWVRPDEGFRIYFQIGFLVALVLAQPVVLWQFLAYLTTVGQTGRERQIGAVVLNSTVALATGLAGGLVVIPPTIRYISIAAGPIPGFEMLWSWHEHLMLAFMLVWLLGQAFGLAALLPGLAWLRILSRARLASWRKYAIVLAVAAAALATPTTDIVSMSTVALPLYLSYELGLLLARLVRVDHSPLPRKGEGDRV